MTRLRGPAFPLAVLLLVPALVASTLALWVAVLGATAATPDAGAALGFGIPLFRGVRDGAAAVAIGVLVLAATALPGEAGSPPGRLGPAGRRAVHVAAVSAAIWVTAGAVLVVLAAAQAAGADLASPGSVIRAVALAVTSEVTFRSLLGLVLAALAALVAARARGTGSAAGALALAVAAVVPLAARAHGAALPGLAAAVQVAHVVAVSTWVGGLAALLLLRRDLGERFGVVVRRYSSVAGWSFAAVLASGALAAVLRVQGLADLATPYGALLLAKSAALLLLGGAGWWQRSRLVPGIERDVRHRGFGRLATTELLVMGTAVGMAVALSGTTPPAARGPGGPSSVPLVQLLPSPGSQAWLTQWDVAWAWLAVAAVSVGLYLAAVIAARRRGRVWPLTATAAWGAGWAVLVATTGGAIAVYGRSVLALHVLAYVSLALVVPVLLVLGRPLHLVQVALPVRTDGSRGVREWIEFLQASRTAGVARRPVPALLLYGAALGAVLFSPLLAPPPTGPAIQPAAAASVLAAGVVLAAALHATMSNAGGALKRQVAVIVAAVAVHAVLGVAVMTRTDVGAGSWSPAVVPAWATDRVADRQLAGELVWAVGALMVTFLALAALRAGALTPRPASRGGAEDGSEGPRAPLSVVSRREVLWGAAGTVGALATAGGLMGAAGGGTRPPARVAPGAPVVERVEELRRRGGTGRTVPVQLTARRTELDLGGRVVQAWGYGDSTEPVRCSVGDVLSVDLMNELPEATTIHWHGLQLRNDMDGVPHLTQDPIAPGSRQRYTFTAPDAGTYWFHPHLGMQRDRGLFAPLIIEDPQDEGDYDVEFVIVLDDWINDRASPEDLVRLLQAGGAGATHQAQVLAGAVDPPWQQWQYDVPRRLAEAPPGHAPYLVLAGEVRYAFHLLNGRLPTAPRTFSALPGQRARLRLINAAGTTTYRVALGGHELSVTHSDGFSVDPVTADTLQIAPGERYDAVVRLADGVFPLVAVAEGQGAQALGVVRTGPGAVPPPDVEPAELAGRLLRLTDLRAARDVDLGDDEANVRHDVYLTGSMQSLSWHINAERYDPRQPFRGITPLPMQEGDRVRLTMINQTPMYHPMHVHGHTFQVSAVGAYDRNPQRIRRGPRKDTLLVPPGQRIDVDLLANNPGQWLTHCHNSIHMATGMATVLSYVHPHR